MTIDAVVIGYGQSGRAVTEALLTAGQTVRVVTRSGSGPDGAERVSADITQPGQAARVIEDAPAIYLCTQASTYSAPVWARELPAMQQPVLDHAKASGAVAVIVENLYAFRANGSPITARTPLDPRSRKGAVRRDLIRAREDSGARVISMAAGDFYGPASWGSHGGDRMMKPLLAGKAVSPLGRVDLPHAFTFLPDLGRAMVRAAALPGEGHEMLISPSAGAITQRELITVTAQAAGVAVPPIRPIPMWMVRSLGVAAPLLRELADVGYQFNEPFTVDTHDDEARLGMKATPWPQAAHESVAWWRKELDIPA